MDHKYVLPVLLLSLLPFQFGLHMAILNAPMEMIGCHGVETPSQDCIPGWTAALPSSIYAVGGLIGSAIAPLLNKSYGIESIILVSGTAFFLGSLLFYWASTYGLIVASRLISGIGAGSAVIAAPIGVSLLTPSHLRSVFGMSTQISINLGIILAQAWGVLWAQDHWRRIIGFAVLVSIAGLGTASVPAISIKHVKKSTRSNSDEDTSINIANGTTIGPVAAIKAEINQFTLLTDSKYRRTLLVSVGIFAAQQLTGINAIVQYGVQILGEVLPEYSRQVNLILTLVNLVMTIAGTFLISRFSRKTLLITSLGLVGLFTATLSFSLVRGLQGLTALAAVLIISSFAVGIGPIPFFYVSEFAPAEAVSAAQSLGMVSSWLSTFAVLALFPKMQDSFGSSAFYLFSACTFTSAIVCALALEKDK